MTEQEAKTRLIQATRELLDQGADPEKLTVRQIASHAGVGLGLINYHFGSKDNLMFEAVADGMQDVVAAAFQPEQKADMPAEDRLRSLLHRTSQIGMRYPKLTAVGVRHDLLNGGLGISQMILPLLRETLGSQKDEISLRLIAFQIITSLQVAFLKRDELGRYLGIDLNDEQAIINMIDLLIENLLPTQKE